jgi:ribosomal 50S subunit-recycling heat shock protein
MKSFTKWFSGPVAIVLLASTVAASDTLIAGKIKSVNAEKKEFVLTDTVNKDHTFELGKAVVINRDGKESSSDLKANDVVSLSYDKGTLAWTAHYILVHDGDAKNCQLRDGTIKNYDAAQKTFVCTDDDGKDGTYVMNGAKVRLNMQPSKGQDLKIGDTILFVVEVIGDKTTLKDLMVTRK